MTRCSGCGDRIQAWETQCNSSLFGSANIILCLSCSDEEEIAIREKGTNDIPELVEACKRPIDVKKYGKM